MAVAPSNDELCPWCEQTDRQTDRQMQRYVDRQEKDGKEIKAIAAGARLAIAGKLALGAGESEG